jgi:hypothetical protein
MRRLADENIELMRLVCSLQQQIAAAKEKNRELLDRMSQFHQMVLKPDEQ